MYQRDRGYHSVSQVVHNATDASGEVTSGTPHVVQTTVATHDPEFAVAHQVAKDARRIGRKKRSCITSPAGAAA